MSSLPPVERLLRAVVEGAPQGVIAADLEGVIQWANPIAENLFGYGAGELTGQPLAIIIPGQKPVRHESQSSDFFRTPPPRRMGAGKDLTGLRKDGSVFPVEINLSYVGPPEGPLAIAFVTDIAERKRQENERHRFFDLSPDLLCVVRRDGSLQQVNQAFAARLGLDPEEMLGRPFGMFTHPEDQEKAARMLERLLAGEDLVQFESRLIVADGSVRWFHWSASAPALGDAMFYVAARDVTEAREAAEAQRRLAALIESIPDLVGLTATDEQEKILHINKGGRELLGLPPLEQLRGMTLKDMEIVTPEVQEQMKEALERRAIWSGETTLRHFRTHERIPVEFSLFLVPSEGGQEAPIARALVARDIRKQKHTEERLRLLTGQLLIVQEAERRRIARDLHDDLTQKVAGVAIELGLLRRDFSSGPVSMRLARVQDQVAKLATDLRSVAHEIHPGILEHAGLSAALKAHCAEVGRLRGLAIHYSAQDVPGGIPADIGVVLYRIAQEAVGNAVKHSGGSLVNVTLSGATRDSAGEAGPKLKAGLRLTVSDNGMGFLVEESRNGLGLGLLNIRERVQLVHGRFSIHSRPGEGCRLEVDVPLP